MSIMGYRSIAIDGPSGAGKSTLAKMLANELHFLYVDTGAIYRTVGLAVYRSEIDPADAELVAALLPKLAITMDYGDNGLQHMYLNGEDVTGAIRMHNISDYTSSVSAIPAVRDFLLELQRRLAQRHDVVMDGRDIGTVVLPQADLKIFLTARAEDRAERRYRDLMARGQKANLAGILEDIIERDRRDMERKTAPLRQAEDAVAVDTTGKELTESFALLREIIRVRLSI